MGKTKKCEHCGKTINMIYADCPLCGGHNASAEEPLSPVCPRCMIPLKPILRDNEEYDVCEQCGGLWLDRDEFHRSTRASSVYREVNTKSQYRKGPCRTPRGYVPCVRCGKLMNKRNFGRISGVIIDRCGKHGVWLDAGELEKIRHFILDGGLERSRDREIARNREQIRELAITVKDVAFTQRLIHFWNPKRWLFRR